MPRGTLLDGEIVIADGTGQADFGALQRRLTLARQSIADAVNERPAVLLAFDVLGLAHEEMVELTLIKRRRALAKLVDGLHLCLQLVAQTTDIEVVEGWLAIAGLEGVVAKRLDRPYVSGRAPDWIKVKRQRTVECAVVGIAGDQMSRRLVLGLRHPDGQLHHFAVTRPIDSDVEGPTADLLAAAGPEQSAIPSRWQHNAVPPWRRVPPTMVCDVRVTNLDLGRWARFPVVFVRWRTDRSVDDYGLEQLSS